MTFVNQSRNSTSFANSPKSDQIIFDDQTFDQVGSDTFLTTINGKAVGDYAFGDVVSTTQFQNQTRN